MTDYTSLFIQMIVVLGFVCVVAFGAIRYILPRLPIGQRIQKNQFIKIVARAYVSPKQNILITQVGGRYFLVGSGDHQLTLLTELNRQDVESA